MGKTTCVLEQTTIRRAICNLPPAPPASCNRCHFKPRHVSSFSQLAARVLLHVAWLQPELDAPTKDFVTSLARPLDRLYIVSSLPRSSGLDLGFDDWLFGFGFDFLTCSSTWTPASTLFVY